MKGVMAFVALSPMRNAHCVTSGEMPIPANTGTKMNDIKLHFAVAETMIRFTRAENRINKIKVHKLPKWIEESISAPIMAKHLFKRVYSKHVNNCDAKKAITKYTPNNFIGCVNPSITSPSER